MNASKLNSLVLFDGAGLAMRGLLDAGHDCTGVELMPEKAHLSKLLNPDAKGHIVANVLDLDMDWIASFDAVWASPPCQSRSMANTSEVTATKVNRTMNDDLLAWSLSLSNDIVWVENVIEPGGYNAWGKRFNAAQFLETPIQNRQRLIGGRYRMPHVFRGYRPEYSYHGVNICPAILAAQWRRVHQNGNFRDSTAESWYGRGLSISETAYHQGLAIPHNLLASWWYPLPGFSAAKWRKNLYEGIGNGVPVYMARAFGEAYSKPVETIPHRQLELFEKVGA